MSDMDTWNTTSNYMAFHVEVHIFTKKEVQNSHVVWISCWTINFSLANRHYIRKITFLKKLREKYITGCSGYNAYSKSYLVNDLLEHTNPEHNLVLHKLQLMEIISSKFRNVSDTPWILMQKYRIHLQHSDMIFFHIEWEYICKT